MSQWREAMGPSLVVHHKEKEAGQASSMPAIPFPSHLPSPIILLYTRLFLRLIVFKITVLGAQL